ncbi:Flp pilus assembly protein CpaB [Kiloniella sp. b19]|uniref:Flp pilus assembly protein CpaB n=1 Tax=Kiloniella sp. GXU_MW_B19 TaxID=3141326 RepID=UPI0031D38E45
MSVRFVFILLLALISATATVFFANNWLQSQRAALSAQFANQQQEVEPEPQIMVLVMKEAVPAGSFLKQEMTQWVSFPEDSVLESYFSQTPERTEEQVFEDITGAVLRNGITPGEPLTRGKIVKPGDRGFLAAVLKAGHRAISVPINATTGISGFIFPGDLVDIVLTHSMPEGETERRVSETILHKVRVLAVDQKVSASEGTPTPAKTATLEVTAKQVEIIAVAMEIGRLSMALRSLALTETEEASIENGVVTYQPEPTYTLDTQASQLLNLPKQVAKKQSTKTIRVIRGNDISKVPVK